MTNTLARATMKFNIIITNEDSLNQQQKQKKNRDEMSGKIWKITFLNENKSAYRRARI